LNKLNCDVLVLGGGLAGLSAAKAAVENGSNIILASNGEKASPHVIGYSVPISNEDSPEFFAADIRSAGRNLNSPFLVKAFTEKAKDLPEWLKKQGVLFDEKDGQYQLMRSLGHSTARLVHHATATGAETLLLLQKQIQSSSATILNQHKCLFIVNESDTVCGAILLDTQSKELIGIETKAIVLATGGCHVTGRSTYPSEQFGDGYALAYNAGATLVDMEFIQHEPLRSVVMPVGLSTTMLAKGGKLLNNEGERFVLKEYDNEGVPTKDKLAQLICAEVQQGKGTEHRGVYADMTGLSEEAFTQHQAIYDRFYQRGIDLKKDMVEVAPAAHSIMGGVLIDENASTGVTGLYAAGEVAGGLHGASRLGGNAGTETIVFGKIAGENAARFAKEANQTHSKAFEEYEKWLARLLKKNVYVHDFSILQKYTYSTMENGMGPVRNEKDLKETSEKLETYASTMRETGIASIDQLEAFSSVSNLLLTCRLACLAATNRKESRGAHARSDFPTELDIIYHIRFDKRNGMRIEQE